MRVALVFVSLGACTPLMNVGDVTIPLEPAASKQVAVVDLDLDGVADLVIDDRVFFGPLVGDRGEPDLELPASGPVRSVADWTGDGVPDLVLRDQLLHGPFLRDRAWQESGRTTWCSRKV